MIQKITPFLWFDRNAEEAMNFYVGIFKNSKIVSIQRYPEGPLEGPMKGFENQVLTGIFELDGQQFMAIDGGPVFKFNESISMLVDCDNQDEVDYYWDKLSAVPEAEQCGWLKDKFGLSWQIVPKQMNDILGGSDKEKARRAMQVMLQMKKLDVAALQAAYDGAA